MNRAVRSPGFSRHEPLEGGTPKPTHGFMVPMHLQKGKRAFHKPHERRVRAPIESGGGPPHSNTLAR